MRKQILIAALALGACSKATTPTAYVDNDVIIPPTTKVTDPETRNALTSFAPDGTLTFSKSTALLAGLKVGDVMASTYAPPAAPYGFLRRVTAVSRAGGQVQVSSTQAALTDAIERGSFHLQKPITMDDVMQFQPASESISLTPASTHPAVLGLTFSFNDGLYIEFDNTSLTLGSTPVNGTVSLNGHLRINPTFNADFSINCFQVERYLFSAELEGDSDLQVGLQLAAAFDKKTSLFSISLTPIDVQVGPIAIVLVPTLNFFFGVKGDIAASVSFHEVNTMDGIAGNSFEQNINFCSGDGGHWTNLNSGGSSGSIDSVSFQISGLIEAYTRIEADVQFFDFLNLGPYFYLNFGPQLNFATPRHPFLEVGLHLLTGMGVELQLFSTDLTQVSLLDYDQLFPIFTSPNSPPVIHVSSPSDGLSFGPTDVISFQAVAYDLEDGTNVNVDWSSDVDGPLGAGANLSTTLSPSVPGLRHITATATDTDGASSSATFSVTISNPGAAVTMRSPADASSAFDNRPLRLSGSAVDPFRPGADLCAAGYSFGWTSSDGSDIVAPTSCNLSTSVASLTLGSDGARNVTLTVTDPSGHATVVTHSVTATPGLVVGYNVGGVNVTSPTAGAFYSATDSVPLNATASGSTAKPPFSTTAPLTYSWSATAYAADGTTVLASMDIGSTVENDKSAGLGSSPPLLWRPSSVAGFLDPTLTAQAGGQRVDLTVTAVDGAGHYGTCSPMPIAVTP